MSLVFVFVNVFQRCQYISYIVLVKSIFLCTTFSTRPSPGIMAAKVGRERLQRVLFGITLNSNVR